MIKKFIQPDVIGGSIATIIWALSSLFLPPTLFREAFSTLYLLFVPGYFLYRIIGKRRIYSFLHALAYSVGLSLCLLMVLGLALNTLFAVARIAQPFAMVPLVATVGGVTLALVTCSALTARRSVLGIKQIREAVWKSDWLLLGVGLLLPFLAVGGANMLNNGGSNWLSVLTMLGVAAYFLTLVWKSEKASTVYPAALFLTALTILLGTSLRGWNITGHDIMQEYQVFQLTLQHLTWNMSYYQDAYNACLSITILPTILHQLTGIAPEYIYKFVFQFFFALIAPIMYFAFSRSVPKKIALLAVFVFLSFPAFLTDVMMLNRQEVALLFLALSLLVGMDRQLGKLSRYALVLIFLVGMILSHYSTSYIAITALLAALASAAVLRRHRKLRRLLRVSSSPALYTWPVVLAALVTLILWNGVITHTANNLLSNVSHVANNIAHLNVNKPAPVAAKDLYAQYVHSAADNRKLPANAYYKDAAAPQYQAAAKAENFLPVNAALAAKGVTETLLSHLYGIVRTGYGGLIELLTVAGMALLVFIAYRKRTNLPAQFVLIGVSVCFIVAVQAAVPPLSVNYGLLRAILEGLVVLALPVVMVSCWLAGKAHVPEKWQTQVIGTCLALLFLVLSGALPAMTGGFKPALALSNSGFYYEAYYTHRAEISGAQWLVRNTPQGSHVYADEFARRKIITYSGSTIFAEPVLLPADIPADSYVYLDEANTTQNDVPAYYNGQLLFYAVPGKFLDTHKNLVYDSGLVKIYK